MKRAQVSICVATLNRPKGLDVLLGCLSRQVSSIVDLELDIHVAVSDNDPTGGARPIVDGWREQGLNITYGIESRRGYASNRNNTVRLARPDDEWLAFVDDDDRPDPEWVSTLVAAALRHGADGAEGPVLVESAALFEGATSRRAGMVDGTPLDVAATCNLLLRRDVLGDAPFNTRFDVTSGEDTELTLRLTRRGHRIVFAEGAIVRTDLRPEEASRAGRLRRHYAGSVRYGWALRHLDAPIAPELVRSTGRAGRGAARWVGSFPARSGSQREAALRDIALASGKVAGLVGLAPQKAWRSTVADYGSTQAVGDEPLVSVLISCHNYEQYVGEAIRSALAQTYRNVEIIVVNDGSTDGSVDEVLAFGDAVTLVSRPRGGPWLAFREGLAHAKGELIAPLDADDTWVPDRLEQIVGVFTRNRELAMVGNQRTIISAAGVPRISRKARLTTGFVADALLRHARYEWPLTSQLVVPKWLTEPLHTYDPGRRVPPDMVLTHLAGLSGTIGAVQQPLTNYRVHDDNRRARTADVGRLRAEREVSLDILNHWAEVLGVNAVVPSSADSELVLLQWQDHEPVSAGQRARALVRTVPEAVRLRRSLLDTSLTIFSRTLLACSRQQGPRVAADGPGQYVVARLRRHTDQARIPNIASSAA